MDFLIIQMKIKYHQAPDIQKVAEEIINRLDWNHINVEHVAFLRSTGSKARFTIARCHALGKAMQIGLGRKKGFYLVEVISEKFDSRLFLRNLINFQLMNK